MHKIIKFPLLLLILFLVSSCTKQSEDSMLSDAKAKLDEAKKLEEQSKPDEARKFYKEAVEIYQQFLKDYPGSPKAAEVYSTIAKIYSEAKISDDKNQDYTNAVRYYKELAEKYPDTKDAKYAMFMIAFIYDEMLKNKELAKEAYRKFLEKYPKDEDVNEKMSESARMMLQMLEENRSIEDIIKNPKIDTTKQKPETKKDSIKTVPKPGPNEKLKDTSGNQGKGPKAPGDATQ
jgi:tetratricopeptide (TPR) repeat protein